MRAVLLDLLERALHRRASGSVAEVDRVDLRRDRRRTAAVSPARAAAYSSSRRIRRGIVSPSMRSMTNPSPRSSSASSRKRTVGTGTPRRAAASSRRYSVERSADPTVEPGIAPQHERVARPVVGHRVERPASRATRRRRAGAGPRSSPARRDGARTSRRGARRRCSGGATTGNLAARVRSAPGSLGGTTRRSRWRRRRPPVDLLASVDLFEELSKSELRKVVGAREAASSSSEDEAVTEEGTRAAAST